MLKKRSRKRAIIPLARNLLLPMFSHNLSPCYLSLVLQHPRTKSIPSFSSCFPQFTDEPCRGQIFVVSKVIFKRPYSLCGIGISPIARTLILLFMEPNIPSSPIDPYADESKSRQSTEGLHSSQVSVNCTYQELCTHLFLQLWPMLMIR